MKSSRKLLPALLVICLLVVPFYAYANTDAMAQGVDVRFVIGDSTCTVNGVPVVMDTAPQIYNGRTLLPIRYVATPLGAAVSWNGNERKVTVTLDGTTIEMWIDNPLARVNGLNMPIDPEDINVKPIIINSRTMLPVRFVSQELNCDVGWDEITRQVKIARSTTPSTETAQVAPAQQQPAQQPPAQQPLAQQPPAQQPPAQQPPAQQPPAQQPPAQQPPAQQPPAQESPALQKPGQALDQLQNAVSNRELSKEEEDPNQGAKKPDGNQKPEDQANDSSSDSVSERLGSGHLLNGQQPALSNPIGQQIGNIKNGPLNPSNGTSNKQGAVSNKFNNLQPNVDFGSINGGKLPSANDTPALSNLQLAQQIAKLKIDFSQNVEEKENWKIAPKNKVMAVKSSESELPIVMRLGRGYDVFGKYASVDSLKQAVLDVDKLVADGLVERIRLDSATNFQKAAKTIKKYSEKMTIDTKISGGYLCFGGSVSSSFDSGRTKELNTYFSTYTYLVKKYGVYIKATTNYKDYLLPDVKKYINNSGIPASAVFGNYGQYILIDSVTGGRVDHSISAKAEQATSFENFKLATKADFDAVVFSASGSASYNNVTNRSKYESTKDERLSSQGGAMTLNLGQFKTDKKTLQNWEATLEDNGTLVAFGNTGARALIPIWELCDSQSRATYLEKEFKKMNESQIEEKKWPTETYIADIKFAIGSTANSARRRCPAGYYLIDKDLNKGAGGKYIYLCYKTTENINYAITDLFAELNDDSHGTKYKKLSHNGNYAEFMSHKGDLNKGSGGDYIYLWSSAEKTRQPIKSLAVIYSKPRPQHHEWDYVKWQNGSKPADINKTVGGKFITILFKR